MIEVDRDIDATPDVVFDVLADGWVYAAWVVGASRVRSVDAGWPREGTRIHHSVGAWPLLVHDTTHVTASGFDADGVPALAALERILHDCRHLDGLDLVVVTGDIADDGSTEGCSAVRERVGAFAGERGIEPIDVAIGALLAQPAVASVIAGATKPDQIRRNVEAGRWRPSDEDRQEIDAIFPPATDLK